MPKRSTGCYRCRQRKIKCDEAKPKCQRCTDIGVDCPGYRSDDIHEFRDQTRHYVKKAQAIHAGTTNSKYFANQSIASSAADPKEQISTMQLPSESSARNSPLTFPTEAPSEITIAPAIRASLYSKFLDSYLPQSSDNFSTNHLSYLYVLQDLERDETTALTAAMAALSLVQAGNSTQDARMLHDARSHYALALRRLWSSLSYPHLHDTDETLAAVQVLGLCELYQAISMNGSAWTSHVQGARYLLEIRGPETIESNASKLLFYSIRWTTMLDGLLRRKTVVFSQPEWLEIAQQDAQTDAWVDLSSIMIDLPSAQESADQAKEAVNLTGPINALPAISNAIRRCQDLRARLGQWFQVLVSQTPWNVYIPVDIETMQSYTSTGGNRTFETVFSFPTTHIGVLLSTYWLGTFMLANELCDIHGVLGDMSNIAQLTNIDEVREEAIQAITNVCQSMPFCCEPQISNAAGKVDTLLCLRFAKDFFARAMYWPQHSWCLAMEQMITQTGLRSPTPPPCDRMQHLNN